ncbi:MAG: hypothetical protein ACRDNS_09530, partial [Trebonia sp.]
MTRPTIPPDPPYPEDDNGRPGAGGPTFTPRQSGPQPRQSGPQRSSQGYDPYPPPPPTPRAPAQGPSFTPHPPDEER